VFDLYKKQSFDNLQEWIKEVEKHAKDNVSIIVMGNKSDKTGTEEREVSDSDIQKFTKETGLRVFEASAKTGFNVESSFLTLTKELIDK
jgi:small GTP-binding protein